MPVITGYNTNVSHAGRKLHVQTEDSGTHRPHLTTHVFIRGGQILATRRTEYGGWPIDGLERGEFIRYLIKLQHGLMISRVRAGKFDQGLELGEHPAAAPFSEAGLELATVRHGLELARAKRARGASESTPEAVGDARVLALTAVAQAQVDPSENLNQIMLADISSALATRAA